MSDSFNTRLEVATEKVEDASLTLNSITNNTNQNVTGTDSGDTRSVARYIYQEGNKVTQSFTETLSETTYQVNRSEQLADLAEDISELGVVSDAIGLDSPSNISWDVDIPFEEGLDIKRGYGTFDANGNRSVDFSRASTSGNVNKSRISEVVAIDEPMITGDNSSSYTITNLLHHSDNINFVEWAKQGISWSNNAFNDNGTTGLHFIEQEVQTVNDKNYCFQCRVKANVNQQYVSLLNGFGSLAGSAVFDIVNGTVFSTAGTVEAAIEDVGGDFYKISIIALGNGTQGGMQLSLMDVTGTTGSYTGDGVSGVTVHEFSVTETAFLAPYVETVDARASLKVDTPATILGGFGSFESFTNHLLHSEDLDQAPWFTSTPTTTLLSQDGTLASDGVTQAWKVNKISGVPSPDTWSQNVPLPLDGEPVMMYQEIKAGTSNVARLRWVEHIGGTLVDKNGTFDLTTGELGGAIHEYTDIKQLGNGWWGVWIANNSNNSGNQQFKFGVEADLLGSIYVSNCMVIDNSVDIGYPYIKTTTTAVTKSGDNASIPSINNLPANGKDFTIVVDANVSLKSDSTIMQSGSSNQDSIEMSREYTFTNFLRHSNNIAFAEWAKQGIAYSSNPLSNAFNDNGTTGFHFVEQEVQTENNKSYCFQCVVRRSQFQQYVALLNGFGSLSGSAIFDIISGTVHSTSGEVEANIIDLGNNFYKIYIIATGNGTEGGMQLALVDPTGTTLSYTGDGVSGVDVKELSVTDTDYLAPYIATSSLPVVSTEIRFGMHDKSGDFVYVVSPIVDDKTHRYVLRYKDQKISSWSDGIFGNDSSTFTPNYNVANDIFLGRNPSEGTSHLNGYIKNFRIYHKALSDSQIKSLGDPQ